MPTATRNLVAVTPGGDITDDMVAGYFTWYSIPEGMLSLRTVRKAFKDNGLDVERLPAERRPEHVFQEACRKIERVEENGHREEIRVEQVMRDGNFLIYQVTRHVQDKQNRVIEHPKALRAIFDFSSAEIVYEPLGGATLDDVKGLREEIQGHYDDNQTKIPGHKLRTILRHYLEAAGAENMRGTSGGVYFLAKENRIPSWSPLYKHHGEVIDGQILLQEVADTLEQIYRVADIHIIPCVNDEGQRAYLKRKFIENCTDDLKQYRDGLVDLVKDKDKRIRGFRRDKIDNLVQQRKEMDERRRRFAEILGETLEELDRDMSLADKALSKFLTEAGEVE